MGISVKDVEHIAELARLKLNETEKKAYTAELSDILSYIEKLNELDTTNVEPTSHVIHMTNAFREDVPRPSLPVDEALSNAPDRKGNFYRVPKIIE
ncbi:MAG: Asp-tRNA(Asn)/Glu-tRNA(Gln) amidotransferase subunit GatC [Nitrospirae bacterium]|nr:MAG: Asp-tRNA(Asn)/Glu-tRNA(Gln) amidotransferase subunit GatC [Nitrospirota bacterium]